MVSAFDPRIVRVTIDIDGTIQEYTNVRIDGRGTKKRSSQLSTATIKLYNLTEKNVQWILIVLVVVVLVLGVYPQPLINLTKDTVNTILINR